MSKLLTCISTDRPLNPEIGDTWLEEDTGLIIVYAGTTDGWISFNLEDYLNQSN